MNNILEKKLEIAGVIIDLAQDHAGNFKLLRRRKSFIKNKRNRKSLARYNKRFNRRIIARQMFKTFMAAVQMQRIISTPIPKFKSGTNGSEESP